MTEKPMVIALMHEPETLIKSELNTIPLFLRIVEHIPVAVYVLSGTKFSYANQVMLKTLGYTWDELSKMNWWEPVDPECQEEVKERGLARQRGEPVPDCYEVKLFTKSGQPIWGEIFYNKLSHLGNEYVIAGAYDITARKQAEAKLQAIQEDLEYLVEMRTDELSRTNDELLRINKNLNAIFENMSDGVLVVNEHGQVNILNQVLNQVWGDRLEEIKERFKEIIIEGLNPNLSALFKYQQPFRDMELVIPTTSSDIHCLASGTPIKTEQSETNTAILIIRPIKDVCNLVNRFSGARAAFHFSDIISNSPYMAEALHLGSTAALNLANVLIQGESGTGKELLAQAIHNYSARRAGPFVALNCGAIPRELIGSELFGYAEGAFTGAKKGGNPGKFELASGGTLFLDEIGDMPFEQQVTLLRVLQEKTVTRIGGHRVAKVDVRIICASNKNLYQEMMRGNFRRDLFYRLNVICIDLPPLRQRREDIALLFQHFLNQYTIGRGLEMPLVQPQVITYMENYDWPGNVRELQNVVERMVYFGQGNTIGVEHLPPEIREPGQEISVPVSLMGNWQAEPKKQQLSARQWFKEAEKNELQNHLKQCVGNITKVAEQLGVSRNTVYARMKKYGIPLPERN